VSTKRQQREQRRFAEQHRPVHPRRALKRAGVKAGPALVVLVVGALVLLLLYIFLRGVE